MDTGYFHPLAAVENVAVNTGVQASLWAPTYFFGIDLEVNLPSHMVILCLTFWETAKLLFLSLMAICLFILNFYWTAVDLQYYVTFRCTT